MKISPEAHNRANVFGESGSYLDIIDDSGIIRHEFGFHIGIYNKDGIKMGQIDVEQLLKLNQVK
jgi:hypothetical protein